MTRLIFKADDGTEQYVELTKANPSIAVGRSNKCAIHTKEQTVSRIHAIITWQPNGSVLVQDPPGVHPVNGTAADGVRLKAHATLDAYNEIRCGLFIIQVEPEDEEENGNFYDSLFEQQPQTALPETPTGHLVAAEQQHSSSSLNQSVVRHSSVSAPLQQRTNAGSSSVDQPIHHSSVSAPLQQRTNIGSSSVDQPNRQSSVLKATSPTITLQPISSSQPVQSSPVAPAPVAPLPPPPAAPSEEDDSVILYYIGPDKKEKTVQLSQYNPLITIGSHPSCTICIPSPFVCSHHASILWNHGRLFVKNIQSDSTETETRIDGMRMNRGDELEFCSDLQCGDFFIFFDPISSDYINSINNTAQSQEQIDAQQDSIIPQQDVQDVEHFAQVYTEEDYSQQNAQCYEQPAQKYPEQSYNQQNVQRYEQPAQKYPEQSYNQQSAQRYEQPAQKYPEQNYNQQSAQRYEQPAQKYPEQNYNQLNAQRYEQPVQNYPEQNYNQQSAQRYEQPVQKYPEQNYNQQSAQRYEQPAQKYPEQNYNQQNELNDELQLSEEELRFLQDSENFPDSEDFGDESESGYKTTLVESSVLPPNPYDDDDDAIVIAQPPRTPMSYPQNGDDDDSIVIAQPPRAPMSYPQNEDDDDAIVIAQPPSRSMQSVQNYQMPDEDDSIVITEQPKPRLQPTPVQMSSNPMASSITGNRINAVPNASQGNAASADPRASSVMINSVPRRRPVVHLAKPTQPDSK